MTTSDESDALEYASDFAAGAPDGYSRLWVPHRMVYVGDDHQPDESDCPFCEAPKHDDESKLIVYRGQHAYVLLNLYPYNGGHVLVCPYRHVSLYEDATAAEIQEIAELTQTAMRVIRGVNNCHGFNIGMNQGEVAGAGIAAHLHQHIVPRWRGDANFLPIVGRTKAVPQLLGEVRTQLAQAWPRKPRATNLQPET
ncbi:MAG: HIT family protein [Canibacter sp.]